MMGCFIPLSREQIFVLPPSMDEWLPENHLARFIVEVVDQLDLSALTQRYSGRGIAGLSPFRHAIASGLRLCHGYILKLKD